ncbi:MULTISPECIES: hypothetical protein [Pelosinus]|uniref:Arginine repressor C-terminal domain-containing protein n=1 Tax=Pelosinus fermentans B4 TaxID=1149862 RepID=I9LGH4_9FIRM|nr:MULTISPECIES: hypothetical protein [Pelosinus]EIW19604.1 hypothetical protein FB4_2787 [Pelosinus fermentans B4]EIW24662.1 arginine repressor [Pelosinus fermentans A11]OAM96057.1 hypothetical protein FR7_04079 [Pelosinus fermentans DSM 17108]SDR35879.1 Arginine repressor [Pelosinus fermentans]
MTSEKFDHSCDDSNKLERENRRNIVHELLAENPNRSLQAILAELNPKLSYVIGKSTLQRDLVALGYQKKGTAWTLTDPDDELYNNRVKRLKSLIANQTISLTSPVQLLAIKTYNGTGRAVASALERLFVMKDPSNKKLTKNKILGTISDERTVLVVIPDNNKLAATIEEIQTFASSANVNLNFKVSKKGE